MTQREILDIAHLSFLDIIKVMIATSGPAVAKGTLLRNALAAGAKVNGATYGSQEEFLAAVAAGDTPLTIIEGPAVHEGSLIFGLPQCPFAGSIRNYRKVFDKLPESFAEFTSEFNQPSTVTDKYRVGEGAGVSPFCAVHQPMRAAVAERVLVAGRPVRVVQLGCKSGAGIKGFADKWIAQTGVAREVVDRVLDNHMCCYAVIIEST